MIVQSVVGVWSSGSHISTLYYLNVSFALFCFELCMLCSGLIAGFDLKNQSEVLGTKE